MKVIAYNVQDKLKIVHPGPGWDIQVIADKDVPAGILYRFIDIEDLPSRETRSDWVVEISESLNDGVGLTKQEFVAKYPGLQNLSVIG